MHNYKATANDCHWYNHDTMDIEQKDTQHLAYDFFLSKDCMIENTYEGYARYGCWEIGATNNEVFVYFDSEYDTDTDAIWTEDACCFYASTNSPNESRDVFYHIIENIFSGNTPFI